MEEKDPSLIMSFPSIPPNFISLQKLQQLRLQEKQDANNKKQQEENQNKVIQVVQLNHEPISSNVFNNNNNNNFKKKKWQSGYQIKVATDKVGSLNTLDQIDFEKSKKKDKQEEEEIHKPTTSNGFYNKKKWDNERQIRKQEVGTFKTLEKIDYVKPKKNKEKEEEVEENKVLDGEISKPTSSDAFSRKTEEESKMGLELQTEIDRKKFQNKMRKKRLKMKKKEEKMKLNLEKQKNNISVNPMLEIVVDEKMKNVEEEKFEVNGDQLWRMRKNKPPPSIQNVAITSAAISMPNAEIEQNFDVIKVTDQKGKNRKSTTVVTMNRGFGGGFGNRRNARGRSGGDNDDKNLMWVKKGESMNSSN